ncbi:MAG: cbb3-type cytochrome c oxidase subunit I, partial [Elusimicrobia bacterium]|nr:cbb3-type cytochrome c oxidase subunit I [Elusimicrobiota bacterium]
MRRLWGAFVVVNVVSFAVLGFVGRKIYTQAPPVPAEVVTPSGAVVLPAGSIEAGQSVWQSMGGMEVGSVWGHGGYVAPDWTADWLHRELIFVLNELSQSELKLPYDKLDADRQALLRSRVERMFRENTYDQSSGRLVIDPLRAKAFESNFSHYSDVFSNGKPEYAIPAGALTDSAKLRQLSGFFFWSAWAAAAQRPGSTYSYTNNWPHEPLIGNRPTGAAVVWSGVSFILLLAGIAGMVSLYAGKGYGAAKSTAPATDPMLSLQPTASQRAVLAYFGVAAGLILAQIGVGVLTAHYGVEGQGFYGIPLAKWLPYVVTRTWHVQLGLFWIATTWLAAGLFIGPIVAGKEPKGQSLGVWVLLGALVVIVVGSLLGEWASVFHKLSGDSWFYWGHQGYEYVDLGRVWQAGLFAGLLIWLALVARCAVPALFGKGNDKQLLLLFVVSAIAIAGFYGAGLMWGAHTHLSIVEYWRWWVVHLWVEGFFEVFATVVIAFLFARMGLVDPDSAARAALMVSTVYLAGGIIGTLHHLYFSGTPSAALAFGAVFSALEVVPLVLMGYEAWDHVHVGRAAPWM